MNYYFDLHTIVWSGSYDFYNNLFSQQITNGFIGVSITIICVSLKKEGQALNGGH
jgi:hypothetical protein